MHATAPAGQGAALVQSPARVLTELNRQFCASDNDGRFLTMVLAVLDTHTGALRFSRAGHPVPLVLRRGELVSVGEAGGFPLAMVDGGEYEDVCEQLEAGDRVVLYSDGMIEQLRPGAGQFGEKRLRSLLTLGAGSPGEELVKDAIDQLTDWAQAKGFADDVTVVVADWLG
jgi:sigma-B regulation protein RsbU (phosphoserine phosphatase)